MSPVGKRLKEARTAAGLSQEKLGVLAGIDEYSSSARMNQYERGKHTPDFGTLSRIAKVLKVSPAYFYAVKDDEAELLARYHRLSKPQQAAVFEFINGLA